jgi:hypothetical protein
LGYGVPKDELRYVAFDLKVNGEFLNYDAFVANCQLYGVPTVPEIINMDFDYNKVKEFANGGTLLSGNHIREGIVVKPVIEGTDPKLGRKILKFISDDYLAGEDMDSVDDQA